MSLTSAAAPLRSAAIGIVLAMLTGCIHATPMADAPIGADETKSLQAALIGECNVTAYQKEGGEKRDDPGGLYFVFGADGKGSTHAFGIPNRFSYTLEGRNLITTGIYKAFRIDDWSTPTIKMFLYDNSQTFYCTKL